MQKMKKYETKITMPLMMEFKMTKLQEWKIKIKTKKMN